MTNTHKHKHNSHTLDDITGNCTACGATHEYMLDYQKVPCVPDGKPHPRIDGPLQFDPPGTVMDAPRDKPFEYVRIPIDDFLDRALADVWTTGTGTGKGLLPD